MNRMLGFALTIVVSVTLLAMNGGKPSAAEDKRAAAPYVHTVIFHLKKDAPQDAATSAIADCHALLTKIPTVRELRVGRPAEKSTPDVSVKDYQFGLVVLFDDYDGLDKYLVHPKHVEFVNKHLKNVEKVLVYDFINQPK